MPMTPDEIEELLAQPIVAVVATIDPDGAPHAVPTWFSWEDGEVLLHTLRRARKYRNLRRDPRITLCVDDKTPPYRAVLLYGRAELSDGIDAERQRRMSVAHMGPEEGERFAQAMLRLPQATVRFRPERVISWDYGKR